MKNYMDKILVAIECAQFAKEKHGENLPLPSSDEIGIIASFCSKNDIPYIAAVKLVILKQIVEAWTRQYVNNVVLGVNGRQFLALDAELKAHTAHEAENNVG